MNTWLNGVFSLVGIRVKGIIREKVGVVHFLNISSCSDTLRHERYYDVYAAKVMPTG